MSRDNDLTAERQRRALLGSQGGQRGDRGLRGRRKDHPARNGREPAREARGPEGRSAGVRRDLGRQPAPGEAAQRPGARTTSFAATCSRHSCWTASSRRPSTRRSRTASSHSPARADWQYQRDEAEYVTSNIVGALDVFDEIDLEHPTPNAGDVEGSIKKAFKRNAGLDADDLFVSTDNGTVTINGTVSSWAEHDEAIDAAWAAPGVTSVDDRMTVAY